MKNKSSLIGTLIFVFTFLSLPLSGTTLAMAQDQTKPAGTVNSNSLGNVPVNSFQCTILSIAAVEIDNNNSNQGENRIYVQCAPPSGGGPSSLAAAIGTNGGNANRYLVILNTAVALGKTVTVYYDINYNNNPAGCLSDCRKLTGLVLGP
jgi:hypothetical protein